MIPVPDVNDRPARILIVDDEVRSRTLLQIMLSAEGYQLSIAVGGAEALALVAQQRPDLILLDLLMPGMDGCQVAIAIKGDAATKNIPVIMITAADDRAARLRALNAGVEEFLTKPVDRAELCVRVRNLLRLKAYGDHYGKYSEMLEAEVDARMADLVERTAALERHAVALRVNEERTAFIMACARVGFWELDPFTQQMMWSEAMAPLLGLPPEQEPASAAEYFTVTHADDREALETAVTQASRDGTDYDIEFRVKWPDGSIHWLSARGRTIRSATDAPARLLGVCMDVSDRKALEAQLRQAQKMEAVGQLAGGVAHDFNNLLTVILAYSDFVLETLAPDDARRSDMNEVVNAGQRATTLTKQLLAFSRKQVMETTTIDVNALVTNMREMLGRLIGEQVDLVAVLAPDIGAVRADVGQMEQVLMNLVVNARDAMPSGGRLAIETANVELDESFIQGVTVRPGCYVMLAVSDSGTGMTEAVKQRLFEPFFTTKELGKGTGLGLATVHGIVAQSGGCIWVYSRPGSGTTFKVFLPCSSGVSRELQAPPEEEVAGGTEIVLLVEDESAVRSLTRRMLERGGYHVFDANSAQQAEALFATNAHMFSLLVTDVIMPGSSGPQLFERLASQRPDLKVLYVSGYTDDTITRHGQLAPGIEFLQKPFTAGALKKRVRQILDH